MELSVHINNIDTQNIYFVEKKKNIIVDGEFVKILYSTDIFEMNGLHILVKWQTIKDTTSHPYQQMLNRNAPKRTITINPTSIENITQIERLCEIEREIIERYIASYCPTKTASYILKTQLLSGTIKYHSDNKECVHLGRKAMKSVAISPSNDNETSVHLGPRKLMRFVVNPPIHFLSVKGTDIEKGTDTEKGTDIIGLIPERGLSEAERVGIGRFSGEATSVPASRAQAELRSENMPSYFQQNDMNIHHAYYSNILGRTRPNCSAVFPITSEKCILKISGVWETPTNVGITMKFILLREGYSSR